LGLGPQAITIVRRGRDLVWEERATRARKVLTGKTDPALWENSAERGAELSCREIAKFGKIIKKGSLRAGSTVCTTRKRKGGGAVEGGKIGGGGKCQHEDEKKKETSSRRRGGLGRGGPNCGRCQKRSKMVAKREGSGTREKKSEE